MEMMDMAADDTREELRRKLRSNFDGRIVRKDLTKKIKEGANVPVYVLEFLLGQYCSSDDETIIEQGVQNVKRILADNFVRPDEAQKILSQLRKNGSHTIIDMVTVHLDIKKDCFFAEFSNLGLTNVPITDDYPEKYDRLLCGGIWCIVQLEYESEGDSSFGITDIDGQPISSKQKKQKDISPISIHKLTPIQMPHIDIEEVREGRKAFTQEEWMDVMLRSCGYEPEQLNNREKWLLLARMLPLVENNFNLCELGPRSTGKSHIYKEISPNSILVSGGQTTVANLFYNMGRKTVGLVGLWDCVAFDEVAGIKFKDKDGIQIMKDYMASGSFARGKEEKAASASMVFVGNINQSVDVLLKTSSLFDPFPPEFNNDSAFFDRIHYYLPGWEIPKMRSSLLTGHYGLITDCLSEFCKEMRRKDFTHHIDRYFRFNSDFNKRDEIAVRKTFSGLAKLLFPDEAMDKDDVHWLLDYAIEGRRRVKEQLKIMAGVEFIDVNLGYMDADNPQDVHVVRVPEQTEDTLIPDGPLLSGHVFGVGRSQGGEVAVYKLENKAVAGECKFKYEGVAFNKPVRDTLEAAFDNFVNLANRVAPGMHIGSKDYLLFYNDLQSKGLSEEVSLAEFVGLCSAACNRPVMPALAIPGILRMSGSMDEIRGLEDIMRVAKNAGAKRVILPLSAIAGLQSVSSEIISGLSPVFYMDGDPVDAAKKALDL